MNIVIPMAGAGNRFAQKGFSTAKPFIEFHGKMMIEHVLDSINQPNDPHYLIIREEFRQTYKTQLEKLSSSYNIMFFSVDKLTQGASCTVLAMHSIINNDTPLLILDSDNLYNQGVLSKFIQYVSLTPLDGAILTFHSNTPVYSYVLLDSQKIAIEVKEKEVISNNAICGVYYFAHGKDFVDNAIHCLIYANMQKGEYYISGVYQSMIKKNKKVGVHTIAQTDWNCVGTPELLEQYMA